MTSKDVNHSSSRPARPITRASEKKNSSHNSVQSHGATRGFSPAYSDAVLESLERYFQSSVSVATKHKEPFNHLHPNYISQMCPFRHHEEHEWCLKDFALIEELGKGSYGSVYVALHKRSTYHCAIKMISKTKMGKKNELALLFQEIRIHLALGYHPNLVSCYGCFDVKGTDDYAVVLELVQGPTLVEYIQSKGDMSFKEMRRLYMQVLMAVQFCHDNHVIHRDLKADNLLVNPASQEVKLTDFGYAIRFNQNRTGFFGTFYYMAPELQLAWDLDGKYQYDYRIDIWACGVLLYEMVTGDVPWRLNEDQYVEFVHDLFERSRQTQRSQNPNIPCFKRLIPAQIRPILSGLLKTDPNQRISLRSVLTNRDLFDGIYQDWNGPGPGSATMPGPSDEEAKQLKKYYHDMTPEMALPAMPAIASTSQQSQPHPLQQVWFSYEVLRQERDPDHRHSSNKSRSNSGSKSASTSRSNSRSRRSGSDRRSNKSDQSNDGQAKKQDSQDHHDHKSQNSCSTCSSKCADSQCREKHWPELQAMSLDTASQPSQSSQASALSSLPPVPVRPVRHHRKKKRKPEHVQSEEKKRRD